MFQVSGQTTDENRNNGKAADPQGEILDETLVMPQVPKKLSEGPVKTATEVLDKLGLDHDMAVDRNTPGVSFILGDFHDEKYRRELAQTLLSLVKSADVRVVGLEGVWGPSRPEILEDRYGLHSLIYGKEVAKKMRESEESLYEPFADFIAQKVKTKNGEPVQVVGMETRETLARSAFVFQQNLLFRNMLEAINQEFMKDPKTTLAAILGPNGNKAVKELSEELGGLNKRVEANPELKVIIGEKLPRYSQEHLASHNAALKYQVDLKKAIDDLVFSARDITSKEAVEKYASTKEGNTAFSMGWLHCRYIGENSKISTIIVHPILPGSDLRKKYDPAIKGFQKSRNIESFKFLDQIKQ